MNDIILGIDIGGSTTKIVGFRGKEMIEPLFVKSTDPTASLYGAFGKFTVENCINLTDIDKIRVTGVGSSFVNKDIYGIKTEHIAEFESMGIGGRHIASVDEAIIVSMGTGTALVFSKNGKTEYLGGTGVGGGTVIGLAKKMLGMSDILQIAALAEQGDLKNIDLRISDITVKNISPTLSGDTTAANFGKVSDIASRADIALGIINMVVETIVMMSVFASRAKQCKTVILTGNLSVMEQIKPMFEIYSRQFGVDFVIPDYANYANAIGAALK